MVDAAMKSAPDPRGGTKATLKAIERSGRAFGRSPICENGFKKK